jgi:thioredoxin 1
MVGQDEGLLPITREKLIRLGEMTLEEKETMTERQQLDSLLKEFYKGFLDPEGLYQRLTECQKQDKQLLLGEAREELENSSKKKGLGIEPEERSHGILNVKLPKEDETEEIVKNVVLELGSQNFGDAVKKYSLLVVDCWAPGCGPCRMAAYIIEKLAGDYQGRIVFGKLNLDENPALGLKYQVRYLPTMLIFKNGELVDRKIGALPRKMLEPELTRHIEEK